MSPVKVTNMKWNWIKQNLLLILTFSGVIFGLGLGFVVRYFEPNSTTILLLAYPGELFIRILKLMILPLVIASLIAGSASLNAKANGKIIVRTVMYFLVTSLANAVIGVLLVIAIHPGSPLTKQALGGQISSMSTHTENINILDGFLDLGRNIFPDNIFQASFQQAHTVYIENGWDSTNASEIITTENPSSEIIREVHYRSGTNTLGIIVFCLIFGTILGSMEEKGKIVVDFFTAVDAVILRIVTGVMWLSPVGVSSVIMSKILSVGNLSTVMSNLALFIITVVLGVFIWQLVLQNILYFLIVGKNPFTFYFNLLEAWATSFATSSTAATLPITFRCMNDKCGVDARISKFVLPIGATVNMDGTALFVAIGTIFIAQMDETALTIGEYATIAITATAASVASASVPSAALALIIIALTAVNLPTEDVSLLFTVDWLVDRFRTTNNMLGDCYTAAFIEEWSQTELKTMDNMNAQQNSVDLKDPEKLIGSGPLLTDESIKLNSFGKQNGTNLMVCIQVDDVEVAKEVNKN